MVDFMRGVLSDKYRRMYDEAMVKHANSGLCARCARKLAVAEVLAVAVRVSETRDRMDMQLAEHGIVVFDSEFPSCT